MSAAPVTPDPSERPHALCTLSSADLGVPGAVWVHHSNTRKRVSKWLVKAAAAPLLLTGSPGRIGDKFSFRVCARVRVPSPCLLAFVLLFPSAHGKVILALPLTHTTEVL